MKRVDGGMAIASALGAGGTAIAACSVRTGRVVRLILWLSAFITLASALAPRLWS